MKTEVVWTDKGRRLHYLKADNSYMALALCGADLPKVAFHRIEIYAGDSFSGDLVVCKSCLRLGEKLGLVPIVIESPTQDEDGDWFEVR